jgi:hypothetical protein
MTPVLISAAILAALPPAARRADLELTDAVEHFVRSAIPTARPPQPWRTAIGALGAECWSCRERATRKLRNASTPADMRWLLWGRHDRDPEVRLRCNNLLRDLTRCPDCWGGGVCRVFRSGQPDGDGPCTNCGQWPWDHFDSPRECLACNGLGYAWVKSAFE